MIDPIFNKEFSLRRRWKHFMFLMSRGVLLPVLRVTLRLRVAGVANIPKRGGAIVICNHLGWFDPPILDAACPRPILFMAKEEFMNYPILRWFAKQSGAFPVRRGTADRKALQHAQNLIADGLFVGMFPEGTRSKTGSLQRAFTGASLVVVRSNALVIPCIMVGTEDLPMSGTKERKRRRFWPKVRVVYGEPFRLASRMPSGERYSLDELTDAMMIEIARMLPPQYRGVYADLATQSHPAVTRETTDELAPAAR
ncbi:MAG: 1-acyl-sn-glycerol-3-phosphate acyltransferase [Thermomicrobiales bacterium]|nr:1-acyl-sn-glycerol-3-phosphate acyltransferase [Thermomicrobiales bacterium]